MKKSIFITVALFAFTSITSQLFAQSEKVVQGQHIKQAILTCRVSTTEAGCSIAFDYDVKSPRDVSPGQSSGKRQYQPLIIRKEFSVSSSDNAVSEVKSPKDAASGQSSGKRQHKSMGVSSSSASSDATAVRGSGGGTGKVNVNDISISKVNVQDFHFTKRCGGKTTKISCASGECEIPVGDCPNGDCVITADWSWGMSQSGTSNRCSVEFSLEIVDGVCHAINTKGTGGTRSGK